MARPLIMNVLGVVILVLLVVVEADTPPGIANNPSHARCLIKKYKTCYNLEHVCPKFCPDSCTVECVSCKPICGPGSAPPPDDKSGSDGKSPPPSDGGDGGKGDNGKGDKGGSDGKGQSPPPSNGGGDNNGDKGGSDGKGGGDNNGDKGGSDGKGGGDNNGDKGGSDGKGGGDNKGDKGGSDGKGGGDDKGGDGKGDKGGSDGKGKSPPPEYSPAPTTPPTPTTPVPSVPPTPTTPAPSVPPSIPPTPTTPAPSPPPVTPPTPTTPPPSTPPTTPPTPTTPAPSPPPATPPTPTTPAPSPPPATPTTPTTPTLSPPPPPPPTPTTPTLSPPPPPPFIPVTPSPVPPTPTPTTPTLSPPPPPPPFIPVTPSPVPPTPPTPAPQPPPAPYAPPQSPGDGSYSAPERRKRCRNRNYPQCYGVQHVCPSSCPNTCEVDCVTCKPVCKCDMPGAVCQDPRFIGGDGITFYFHGKKGKDFCLVTQPNFQINAHFIGKTNQNMKRDFTWVQSIGILFGRHQILIAAQKTATWNDAVDRLSLAIDAEPIALPASEGSTWQSRDVTITRDSDTNSVVIEVAKLFKISAKAVPITQHESKVHNYGITEDDCFAHLELGFKFYSLTGSVNGVLGQTYAENYVSRAKMGVSMPVLGGEKEFAVSNIFASDCSVSQFRAGEMSPVKQVSSVLELPSMKCGSGLDGIGVVCKK